MCAAPSYAMLGQTHAPLTDTEKERVLNHTERILNHASFSRSDRCKRVLHYMVEHALQYPDGHLKERTIGHQVFHRAADYDTNADTIVRTTASEIRKRLAQY